MGKRSNFERVPRDYYPTPIHAVEPLIPHLPYSFKYIEPCAGDGRLIKHLTKLTDGMAECILALDIEPKADHIIKGDALHFHGASEFDAEILTITNPPWQRRVLHPIIDQYLDICPTWLLFDADWMHTKQSSFLMTYCKKIVSVGRVKWIEGSKSSGKDNCCWYLFDKTNKEATEFYGRNVE